MDNRKLIYVDDAIDAFKKELTVGESKGNYVTICSAVGYEGAKQILERLPSVQERKGRWIDCVGSDHWKCSECGDRAPMYWDANRQEYDEWFSPYCPNCGAHMEGAEE